MILSVLIILNDTGMDSRGILTFLIVTVCIVDHFVAISVLIKYLIERTFVNQLSLLLSPSCHCQQSCFHYRMNINMYNRLYNYTCVTKIDTIIV